jgi:COP9 signalosome complex subunit 1
VRAPPARPAIALTRAGRTALDRLFHVMTACPALAGGAAAHAARTIPGTRDPALYAALQAAYDAARARADLPPFADTVRPDRAWADATATRNSAERQKLEVELKNYTNNMIKESIRVRALLVFVDVR